MADARAGVHVICAEEARHFLVRVIRFVGESARSDVPGKALRSCGFQSLGCNGNCFVPGNLAKAVFTAPPKHREGKPAEFEELAGRQAAELRHIFKKARVHRGHGVETQQLQTDGAQMDALHRPVAHPCGAQGAAIAAAIVQDPPGVSEVVAVLPNG